MTLIALFWRLIGNLGLGDGLHLGLLAPLGASAFMVYALPASPMAQPWPVVVGNTLSVAVGLTENLATRAFKQVDGEWRQGWGTLPTATGGTPK